MEKEVALAVATVVYVSFLFLGTNKNYKHRKAFLWMGAVGLGLCLYAYFLHDELKTMPAPKYEELEASELKKPPFPIDVVYTWAGEKHSEDNIRMADHGELKHSLRSVYHFLPWVNRIYIVMNEKKKPSWFNDDYEKYVTILGHDEVFTDDIEHVQPVTNSNSIETAISNVPGLSEHFIYFNDDVFVARPLRYTYFFTEDGQAVVNPGTKLADISRARFDGVLPPLAKGFHAHTPFPMIKSKFAEFKSDFRDYIAWIRQFNTRDGLGCDMCDAAGLPCPCQSLHGTFSLYMKQKGVAVDRDRKITDKMDRHWSYFAHTRGLKKLKRIKPSRLDNVFTVNDAAKGDRERRRAAEIITGFLKRMYPNPAPFEKS